MTAQSNKDFITNLFGDPNENVQRVKSAINRGWNVNTRASAGITALHMAAWYGNVELVKLLLRNNASVNVKNIDGETPLHGACKIEEGNPEVVRLLLDAGAKVDARDNDGYLPIHHVLLVNFPDGEPEEDEVLQHIKVVKLLLSRGASPTAEEVKHGRTPLMISAYMIGYVMTKFLLTIESVRNGINKKDPLGDTALSWAVMGVNHSRYNGRDLDPYEEVDRWIDDKPELVKLLLDAGADIHNANKEGETALHISSEEGMMESLRILLQYGANITKKNKSGLTPVQHTESPHIRKVLREATDDKMLLLKRFLTKNGSSNFRDPISQVNYNARTLRALDSGNSDLNKVGLIVDNRNNPIRLVDYNSVNNALFNSGVKHSIGGIMNKNWKLIPFTREELNEAYRSSNRVRAVVKGARTRKNLSTIRSSTSSDNNKAFAESRIKKNENNVARVYRDIRRSEQEILSGGNATPNMQSLSLNHTGDGPPPSSS